MYAVLNPYSDTNYLFPGAHQETMWKSIVWSNYAGYVSDFIARSHLVTRLYFPSKGLYSEPLVRLPNRYGTMVQMIFVI